MDGSNAPHSARHRPPRLAALLVHVMLLLIAAAGLPAAGQETITVSGDRLSGIVLPVEPLDGAIAISALRADAWTVDDTKRLRLRGDVVLSIGDFTFHADGAVIWINRIPSADGVINQIAAYFDNARNPQGRAGVSASGDRLLITASARGDVLLNVALMNEGRPRNDRFVAEGETRLAAHIAGVLRPGTTLKRYPQVHGGAVDAETRRARQRGELVEVQLPGESDDLPIIHPSGRFAVAAGRIEVQSGEEENTLLGSGGVVVEYAEESGRRLTLSAERVVVFTDPGQLSELPSIAIDASFVRGVYLEGNVVVSDERYTVRANRAFYDVRTDQAILLDGVLRTYTREIARPVYARAEEFRQLSRSQWQAERAIVSTSEFRTPHLALGAKQVTITDRPSDAGDVDTVAQTHIDSRGNTVRVAGTPVFYWPRLKGTLSDVPLRSISGGHSKNNGVFIETLWDLYSLLGIEREEGTDLRLRLDAYTRRAAAVGIEFEYDLSEASGLLDLYGMYDSGTDRTSSGRDVEHDGDFRGVVLWEHQSDLSRDLTLQLQTSYISDESFITTWRESDFAERREYETSAYLRHLDEHTAWTLLTSYDLNSFTSNDWLLASRPWQVDRVPELTYRRYGDSLFKDRVTYSSEYRVTRARFSFDESTPRELGVPGEAFGLGPDDRIDEALRSAGFPTRFVNRFDTRHEVALPSAVGAVRVVPFLVGRFTAWDDDFAGFSSDEDHTRLFGAAGLRLSTTLQHVDNSVYSALFDLNRLRHIVEPSVLLWYGYSSLDQSNLPPYDVEVESLADAFAVRLGVKQTWQTQRGGPGRWRTVDVFKVDTALILASGDADREHPTPQFYEYRPEYSILSDHVFTRAVWQASDTLAFITEATYDLDDSRVARGSVGFELRHSPIFSTFVEFRYIDASDNELLGVHWFYQITPKYAVTVSPQWDFQRDDFRSFRVTVVRSFPDFDLLFIADRDEVRDETSFSLSLRLAEF
ncbi:MAG: LPS assembly protein LptD [Phycisphaerales bacterium]